jgi:hypothetical protein
MEGMGTSIIKVDMNGFISMERCRSLERGQFERMEGKIPVEKPRAGSPALHLESGVAPLIANGFPDSEA